jgi:hypothetical protein
MPSNSMDIDGDSVVEDIALVLKYQHFSEYSFFRRTLCLSNGARDKISFHMRLGLLLPFDRC